MQEQIVGGPQAAKTDVAPPPAQDTSAEDAALEAQVRARRARRERAEAEQDDPDVRPTAETLKAASKDQPVTDEEIHDALEFFLASDAEEEVKVTPTPMRLNLGTAKKPQYIRWEIVPVPDTEITRIRRESVRGTRAQRRRGDAEVDENLVARKIVTLGTVNPDLTTLARQLRVVDPTDALHAYFAKFGKTGLITQISGEILGISGWDDEDISEVESARG